MPAKLATRLNEPVQADKIWFNKVMAIAKDFFADPAYHPEYFTFDRGKIIYPVEPERITWQRTQLIRKHATPHPSLWLNRIDLFLITIEGDDWERIFSANLAGIDRRSHLRAQDEIKKDCPDTATVEGQTYWRLVAELAADLMLINDANVAFVSPLLHHLDTGELSPLNPLEDPTERGKPLFERGFTSEEYRMKDGDRRWMQTQSRLQEHQSIDLFLDKYGFIQEL